MAKTIKAKSDLGVNSIMDPIMVPDGFSRVCDGLDLRSGVCKTWQLPAYHRPLGSTTTTCIWEYRGKWHESDLMRTYHGEYLYGQEIVYFAEEGIGHLPPQKIIDGTQVRLGIKRPIAEPIISSYASRSPTSLAFYNKGAGGVQPPVASYRVAAVKDGNILTPSGSLKVQVITAATIQVVWRKVPGADGYAVFGRTSGSERLLVMLGDVNSWTDDGTATEGQIAAASYDTATSYQYVYTYYRKIGTVEDESGPSPISDPSTPGSTPVITRLPNSDGLYSEGATVFHVSVNTLTAYVPASSMKTICYSLVNESSTATTLITNTVHSLASGATGRLLGSTTASGDVDLVATVPAALSAPNMTLNSYPTGGTLTVGAHQYKFTAVRGCVDFVVTNPAQTLATTVNVTIPGGSGSVRFNIAGFSPGTHSIIAYRDGVPVAFIHPVSISGKTAVATWTDDGTPWWQSLTGVSIPASNETSTRCVTVPVVAVLPPNFAVPSIIGTFQLSLSEIALTGAAGFAPAAGDVIYLYGLSSLSALNGSARVVSYDAGTGKATIAKFLYSGLSGATDSGSGTLTWRLGNGSYSGWRIYRVGDTSEFLLVVDLPMDVESYTDLVSVDKLGIAIPTAYNANGLEVVYDRAPDGLKRMVPHFGMRFGIVDNIVRWTPNNVPDAWPDVYYAAFPSRPVALASYKGVLSVVCEDGLYALVGNTASTMSPAGPFSNLGCIAPFSLQASNVGLMWLTKTGVAISRDGTSATCLTADKVPGRYFYAPSTPGLQGNGPIGYGWYLPATQTVQFAESMAMEQVDDSMFPVSQVTSDLPMSGEISDIKSFFWDNRYVLYYSSSVGHARSGCVVVDMATQQLDLTTLPIKPLSVHVSLGGDCYMLLNPRPITTVVITSPI